MSAKKKARKNRESFNCQLCDFFQKEPEFLGFGREAVINFRYGPLEERHEQHRYMTGLPTAHGRLMDEDEWGSKTTRTFGIEFEGHGDHLGIKSRNLSATNVDYGILLG